jgi:hypothetical protein
MNNLLIPHPKVKPSTPPSAQPPSLPQDFLDRYRQWLLQKGLDQRQAHWREDVGYGVAQGGRGALIPGG